LVALRSTTDITGPADGFASVENDPQRTSTTGCGLFLAFSPHRSVRLEARGILDEDEQDAVIEAANLPVY
jgi:hypothetical protein